MNVPWEHGPRQDEIERAPDPSWAAEGEWRTLWAWLQAWTSRRWWVGRPPSPRPWWRLLG